MTTIQRAALVLALSGATTLAHAGGYRRGSYGGGARHAVGSSRAAAAPVAYGTGQISQAPQGTSTAPSAPVRGRGSVGYGQHAAGYTSSGSGYARSAGGSFGSFGQGARLGANLRSFAPRYAVVPAGGVPTTPPPASDPEPVQGFAVPGALIRTAGLGHKVSEPSQPAREHLIAAGAIAIQDNLARNEAGRGLHHVPADARATPAGGKSGTRPNAPIVGLNGQTFGD